MPSDFHIDVRHDAPRRGPSRPGGELAIIVAALVLAAATGSGWWLYSRLVKANRQPAPAAAVAAAQAPAEAALPHARAETDGAGDNGSARESAVPDADGALLWISPTAGPPLSPAFMPPGTQCLVALRPALMAAHPEGEKVLTALGPWGASMLGELRSLSGAELAEIVAVLVAVTARADGRLDVTLRAELAEPWADDELARRWPEADERTHGETTYRVEGDRAMFLTSSTTLVACPSELVHDLIDSAGQPPLLPRDVESLVAASDALRAVTIIVAPQFLAAGGTHVLEGPAQPLRTALAWLLNDAATAVALSAHWDDNFFVELRAAPALNVPPRRLALALAERIAEAPGAIEEQVVARTWPAYGRKVLVRFPGMVRKLAGYTRRGESERHAVLRAYLPPIAGHNLLMGAELLLTQAGISADDAPIAAAVAEPSGTIEQRLAVRTSLAFPRDSLQRALELLAADVGVEIVIDGRELQLEGIPQNQSFQLELRDQPAGDILVEILRRANPDRTAESPADPRQKLVYWIDAAAPPGGRIIVTTRAAAERQRRPLPAAFGGRAW